MSRMRGLFLGGALLWGTMPWAAAPAAEEKGFVILPTVYRVGAFGPPCTHTTLAAALADAPALGETIVRLADNQLHTDVNVNISGRNVTIEGGYPDCAAAVPGGGRTPLAGAPAAGDSVIEFTGGASLRTLTLRHLEIRGGSVDLDGGGGLQVDGEADVVLENVRFEDNDSAFGGAIRLVGTAADPVELRVPLGGSNGAVLISANRSTGSGAGISCQGAAIRVTGTLAVATNQAAIGGAGDGGGIDLTDCSLVVGLLGADPAELLVSGNSARRGGGLHVGGTSTVLLRGARAHFQANTAQEGGAALRAAGGTTSIGNLFMTSNLVSPPGGVAPRGGAILLEGDASLSIGQTFEPCSNAPSGATLACNTLRNNRINAAATLQPARGGAIAVRGDGAVLTLNQAYVGDNEIVSASGGAYGAGLFADDNGDGGTLLLDLESVVFDRNTGSDEEVHLGDGADAVIAYSSFNFLPGGDAAIRTETGATLELHANVSLANAFIDASGGGAVAGDCNFLGLGDDSFASVATVTQTDVRDSANGDLRPTHSAIMRDRCGTSLYLPLPRDALHATRPIDLPDVADGAGPYDAGAYELHPDAVFSDGFEPP